jgi:hypothetical protein
MVHIKTRFVVLGLLGAILLATVGGAPAAGQAGVCNSSSGGYYLKIKSVNGESRSESEERCDRDATITTRVGPETDQSLRPAETIIIVVVQPTGSGN